MKNYKMFFQFLAIFIWAFAIIVTSVGAMTTSDPFFIVAGVLNLLINGWFIYKNIKSILFPKSK